MSKQTGFIQKMITHGLAVVCYIFFVNTVTSQNPIEGNQGFLVLTEANFTSTDAYAIHGPVLVGGNFIVNKATWATGEIMKTDNGSYIFPGDGAVKTGLLVNGSITWTSGQVSVQNNSYVHIGNGAGSTSSDNSNSGPTHTYGSAGNYSTNPRITSTIDQTPSPAVFQTSPFDVTSLFDTYRNYAFGMSNCTNNVQLQNSSGVNISGNTVSSPQGVYINNLATGVNHLKLTTSSLANIQGIVFQGAGIPSATKILVVTVVPTTNFTWNLPWTSGVSTTESPYMLWNFSGGTTYTLTLAQSNAFYGTLFAPNFNVVKNDYSNIHGAIICKNLTMSTGSVLYYPFNADVPKCCNNVTTAGAISGDQTDLCGYDPTVTINTTSASGGTGTLEYRWDRSTNGGGIWNEIPTATATTFNQSIINATTLLRRKARRRGCDVFLTTNTVTKTVTPISVSISGNTNVCPGGSTTLTATSAGVGGNYLWNNGATTQSVTVSPGPSSTYTVTVTQSNGCSNTAAVTVSEVSCNGTSCFISTNSVYVTSDYTISYTLDPANNSVRFRTTLSKNYVDNTYGVNAIGWGSGHTFNNLTDSDAITMAVYDAANVKKLEFKLDYLSASGAVPSGYKSLGVSGGDGSMILGNASDILSATTSLDENFNTHNYVLTTDSPETDNNYASDPIYPNWIYDVWYDVEIKLSAIGAGGFGRVAVTTVHASPAKIGATDEPVNGITCCDFFEPTTYGPTTFCAESNDPIEIGVNENNCTYLWSTGETTQFIDAPKGNTTFTVTVTNSEGCSKVLTKTMTVKTCLGQSCFNGSNDITSRANWSIVYGTDPADDYVNIRVSLPKNLVDNTYGTNAIGWPSSHTFSNLTGAEFLTMALFDTNGVKQMELKLDYLSADASAPSGYSSLGVLGGEGSMLVGNASDVIDVQTSLDVNLNEYGYVLTSNSPATNSSYDINAIYPNWIFDVWYEVNVKLSAFGAAGFGNVSIPNYETSPSKFGSSYYAVTEGPCCQITVNIVGVDSVCGGSSTLLTANSIANLEVSLIAFEDTYLSQASTGTNYGSCNRLYTGLGSSSRARSLIKFDLSSIPAGSTIISANLVMTKTGGSSSAATPIAAHRITNPWTENTGSCSGRSRAASWNQRMTSTNWTTAGGDFSSTAESTVTVAANAQYTWNVKNLVQAWVNGTYTNNGLMLKRVTEGSANQKYFASSEATSASQRPRLDIVYQGPPTGAIVNWSNGNIGESISVAPEVNTLYTAVVNDIYNCYGEESIEVTVSPRPGVDFIGSTVICKDSTTQLSPSTGGTWTSSDVAIATVTNAGVVTGVNTGTASFTFTSTANNCSSEPTENLSVTNPPIVSITGSTTICEGSTSALSPTSGGTWTSNNPSVATVNDSGEVTAVSAGSATFYFTSTVSGCRSASTASITVVARPIVNVSGTSAICPSTTTTLTPTSGGSWISNDPLVATVASNGLVTGVGVGSTTFVFTSTSTGCTSLPSPAVTVNAKPIATLSGSNTVCIGTSINITPSTGGTWVSSNSSVASIDNGGVITGVSVGSATFTYTSTSTGCISNPSSTVTVSTRPSASISGSTSLCIGTTSTLIPSSGGVWVSSNPAVASVDGSGVVTGLSNGIAHFTFTQYTTGCSSDATNNIIVNEKPIVSITGATSVCLGFSTTISPTTGGTWVSSNTNVATVTNSGVVTGIAPGTATFVYTLNATNCISNATGLITVNALPVPNVTGGTSICNGTTTTLSPTTGGTWVSSNPGVATVTDDGTVTGITPGSASFTFTQTSTSCVSPPSAVVTVNTKPIASISGASTICEGTTTTLYPAVGGSWTSSSPLVASVTSGGVVTGLGGGSATFIYRQTSTGCDSDPTASVIINPKPDILVTGPDSICVDGNSQLSPTSGGSWASLTPDIASVTSGGLITALSAGNAYFRYTESLTGCLSDSSQLIKIADKPLAILTGPSDICIGNTTSLFPTSGGTWISSNNAVASITNGGIVTGLTAGPVTFTYIQNVSLCQSLASTPINVIARPDIQVDGDTILCIGETSSLTPSFGGTWTSLDPSIAAIDNAGIITGHDAGTTSFYFIDAVSGCVSDTSIYFSINNLPTVSITGVDSICIAESTSLNPTTGGQWVSSDPAVAEVDASGNVTGISAGNVAFVFIDDVNHCSSEPTDSITIKGKEIVLIDGDSSICIGSQTYLIPNNGGSWQSTNPLVATVNNNGLVSAISEGSVSFIFTDSGTGCSSDTSDAVIVNGKPVISLAGPNMYCEGDTTQLLPSTGGSWTSSNVSIATISSSGNALGINGGLVKFIFTDAATGCDSDSSEWVEVIDRPNILILGSDAVCVGTNAFLLPGAGGIWQSTNPAVATIDNTGTVTGLMAGSSTFIFTESIHGCSSFPSDSIDFLVKPIVSVTGLSVICENDSTHLSPSSGGTWTSSDNDIATVDSSGLVIGKSGGAAQFIFTLSGSSCSSDPTSVININANPDISHLGSAILCLGQTAQMTPNTGGTWISNQPLTASIDNSGLIQTLGLGTFKVIFTSSTTGCKSDSSQLITVYSVPVVAITGNDTLCQGATSTLSPSSGGIWTSGNDAVATVQNNGQITAIADGSVSFIFTSAVSGCASLPTSIIRVYDNPIVSISGASIICEDITTQLLPSVGGFWTSSHPSIATITDAGVATGISGGSARFMFTETSTGCTSDPTNWITVFDQPDISLTGLSQICLGSTTQFLPGSGGSWVSSDPGIATISNSGLVNSIAEGIVRFIFTSSLTGCASDSSIEVVVHPIPVASITGNDSLCVGTNTWLSPTLGGTWTSSNPTVATANEEGVVLGHNAGNIRFTFTSFANCVSNQTNPIEVLDDPEIYMVGLDSLCINEYALGFPVSGGTWISTNPSVASVSLHGVIVAHQPGFADFYFISDTTGCASSEILDVVVNPRPTASLTGPDIICIGSTTTLSPVVGGVWDSTDPSVAGANSNGVVTGLLNGSTRFVFTDANTGCSSDTTDLLTVNDVPAVGLDGPAVLCVGATTQLTSVTAGSWLSSNSSVATVTSEGLVMAVSQGTVDFTFHSSVSGCPSNSISGIVVNGKPTVNIDLVGSACVNSSTQLQALVSGGSSPYIFNWEGPNSYTASAQSVNITSNGTYRVTVTDEKGCVAENTAFIHELFEPLIITLQPEVCEGTSVTLIASGTNAISYQWGANAGNATTQAVSVLPTFPSTTYVVTVTNDIGCSNTAVSTILAKQTPLVHITGSDSICVGGTTTLTPSAGGSWLTTNGSVASITSSGLVTGLTPGTSTFIYTSSENGCSSRASFPVYVLKRPYVEITGDTSLCLGGSSTLFPSVGGTWTSSHPTIATVSNSGIVTGISPGNAAFTFVSDTTACSSVTDSIDVNQHEGSVISGDNSICVGETSLLSASNPGGSWSSSNATIASINSSGLISGMSPGSATITYVRNTGACVNYSTFQVVINPIPSTAISGSAVVCAGSTTTLSPVSGGTWISNDPSIASITNGGLVSGIQAGNVSFVFTNTSTGCVSSASAPITVLSKPTVSIIGPSVVCSESTTQLTPVSGGTWVSSNSAVASVTTGGVVTGITGGSASFTFTQASNGCISDPTLPITIHAKPNLSIQVNGSQCLTDSTALFANVTSGLAPYNYQWIGPSLSSTLDSINVIAAGPYEVTVSDQNLCTSSATVSIFDPYIPAIVASKTDICEGESVQLTVNASSATSYQWSANTGGATTATLSIYPAVPSTLYIVTVTSINGCTATASRNIVVNARPIAAISGPSNICLGQVTSLTPGSGGIWLSSNPSIATVNTSGVVQGVAAGTASFTFTNVSTGCSSVPTTPVAVNAKPVASITGPSTICVGASTTLHPESGGTWQSSDVTLATISNAGIVTALNAGVVYFTYTLSSSNCSSDPSSPITINPKPGISYTGPLALCLGSNTSLTPGSGGIWTSSNPTVASINNNGFVTSIGAGSTTFQFTLTSTGCASDISPTLTVNGNPVVSVTGDTILCVGEISQASASEAGTWTSSNVSTATINNNGVINASGPGLVSFTFTSSATGCSSLPTRTILVNPNPSTSIDGPSAICLNTTTQLNPASGGVWTSLNPLIASVDAGGLVTGIAQGQTNFSYTDAYTGCSSIVAQPILVYGKPNAQITGPKNICIGGTTTLQPTSGGFWISSNNSIATINGGGIATGISVGSARFIFIESVSGCISDSTDWITVSIKPAASLTGPGILCIDETSAAIPSSGGVWISNNPGTALINNAGIITAIGQGQASFSYTPTGGCPSDPVGPVIVNGKPQITNNASTDLCPGQYMQFSPSSGGDWYSQNPLVASINDHGQVSVINTGTTKFVFRDSITGCYSDSSALFTVHPRPFVALVGPSVICVGNTTQLSPTVGGIWTTTNEFVAPVGNNGVVTGVGAGTASFKFINITTGCESNIPLSVTVNAKPIVTIPQAHLCKYDTLLLPAPGVGSWMSLNPSIGSINGNGKVTALSQGIARFRFTLASTGCVSDPSGSLLVNDLPNTSFIGPGEICIGMTTQVHPSTGGIWESDNEDVVLVDNMGVATGIDIGNAPLFYTDTITGCTSDGSLIISVISPVSVGVNGPTEICIGYETQLFPNIGGIWTSTDLGIALVDNNGKVIGVAPGKASFSYTEIETGCISRMVLDAVVVKACLDPDFNVAARNTLLTGNVATNDEVVTGMTYGSIVTSLAKPLGSNAFFTVLPNGDYQFSTTMPGEYIYRISACVTSGNFDCNFSELNIKVIDPFDFNSKPIGNVDIGTTNLVSNTEMGEPIAIDPLFNDRCVKGTGCMLDTQSVNILTNPKYGVATVLPNGSIYYISNPAFKGLDTLIYRACVEGEPYNCFNSKQIITVNALNAENSTVAADDIAITGKNTAFYTNVMMNDSDPEGESISVIPQGSAGSQVVTPKGSYYLTAGGDLYFEPAQDYKGSVDIVYTLCDGHSPSFCANATLHILILDDISLKIRVYLEGSLRENGNAYSPQGKPLMRDNLRLNPVTNQNHIPLMDPYRNPMPNFDLSYRYGAITQGNTALFETIQDSVAVFAVNDHNAVIDWVFIELRAKEDSTQVIGARAGLLQRDGDVVDVDGVSNLSFPGVLTDSLFVVVRHRSHLGAMSMKVSYQQLVDFTSPDMPVFNFGTSRNDGNDYTGLSMNDKVINGYMTLWAGDFNGDGKIKFTNPNDDLNYLFFDVFIHPENTLGNANFNYAYGYYSGDVNMNGKVKFDNPNDDKNLLYAQILFHPLNIDFLSNFNDFIEQIP